MKEKAKEKTETELKNWSYLDELKDDIFGFKLKKEMKEDGAVFQIFSYENADEHKNVCAYFHDETMEYKVSVSIGLINFCDVSFFADSIKIFEKNLRENLEKQIGILARKEDENTSFLIEEKGITDWDFEKDLPKNLEGFSLFSTPQNPTLTINGSYIIFDYTDFSINSNFAIFYNIFRDEFFGESRIDGTPTVTYDFDSKNLKELEEKLKTNMVNYLKEIRITATT